MCVDPVSALLVVSAAVGAYSSVRAGQAKYQSEMFSAQVARNNAQSVEDDKQLTKDAAAIERRRIGERIRAEKGDMNAKFTAMGIDPLYGTPADLIGDVGTAGRADLGISGRNEITNLKQLDKQQADYLDSAKMHTASGKGALTAGYLGAAKSLLDGASSVAGHWIQPGTGNFTPGITDAPMLSSTGYSFPRLRSATTIPIGGGP